MDEKNGKKKESIDDILSDLNGLLNKMPSILDGIRMPEMKPVEFTAPEPKKPQPAPAPAPEPELKTPEANPEADKTVVMQAFSGLPEGAPEPQTPSASDADKTMIVDSFSSVPEGGQAPGSDKLVLQSLGDFMFGDDSREPGEPASKASPEPEPAPELPVMEPEPQEQKAPAAASSEINPFESTRDFGGIPDIDALIQMSDGKAPQEKPEPAPEPVPAVEIQAAGQTSVDELAEFEKQLQASVPQGEVMEKKPEDEKPAELAPAPEQAPEPAGLVLEPSSEPKTELEGLTLEPKPEPAVEAPQTEPQASETLQLEPIASVSQPPPAAGGIELSIGEQAGSTQEFGVPAAQPEPAPAPEQGLVLESASSVLTPQEPSGDATLVMPPPAGDEDKTVIFEAGAAPGVTSRSQAGDLAGLAGRPVPEGIPADRVRSIMFLYAPEDKALCATVMAELDAICLKSADKPMFVKRAAVRECSPDMNGNYLQQSVADAGGQGLICVGAIPQEKVYEIESVFASSGGFFRHYDSASFSHSSALDLVLDLVLK
ncbi:MAG: hypothetical protein HY952_03960 [Elusimicrobia bacterium]|nr:hypothetical protein [Elusimicrobiota bacterium]